MLRPGLPLMMFGPFGVKMLRLVYLGLMLLLEVLQLLAALPFLVEVCYGFVKGVWEAELLAAGVLVKLYRVSQGDEVDVRCAHYFC